ncbi:hypothetical protein IFR05_009766 [Cadophora sp. M221]|nr:hypothetical protein IFR05_009766 [Cadophora sp. M221]
MDSATPPVTSACAQCSKSAIRICAGCRDAPVITGGIQSIHYCSNECQVADWPTHKMICKGLKYRKILYRAGATLQQIFYLYREQVFDTVFTKFEEKDGKFYIHEGATTTPHNNNHASLPLPFPHDLCGSVEHKQAMLVHRTSGEANNLSSPDIASSITEISFKLKNPSHELVIIGPNGENLPHTPQTMLLVTLKHSGEKYVVYLAGAIFGFHQPVHPWADFEARHVRTGEGAAPTETESFGHARGAFLRVIHVMEGLEFGSVLDWEEQGSLTVKALIDLSEEQFKLKQK